MKKLFVSVALSAMFATDSLSATDVVVIGPGDMVDTVVRSGVSTTYEYDAVGNITREGDTWYDHSDAGALMRVRTTDHDTVFSYDTAGCMISNGMATMAYTQFNMMETYSAKGVMCSYLYDQLSGLRTGKSVGGRVTRFILDDSGRVAEERTQDGSLISAISWDGDLPGSYTYGGQVYRYVCNFRGDVIGLTDSAGRLVNSYSYDIWGKAERTEEAVPNPIRYAHEYFDTESGFYYLRGRYYDPSIRQFTTPDPAEDGLSWYAYCGNNPLFNIDPSGYAFFRIEGRYGRDFLVKKYYSGADLIELFSIPSPVESAAAGITVALVKRFLPMLAVAFTPSLLYKAAEASIIGAKAKEAHTKRQGLEIDMTIFEDASIPRIAFRFIPAKDVEDFAAGRRKPTL